MNRREFAGLLPAAMAATALNTNAQQTASNPPAGSETTIAAGTFNGFTPPENFTGRAGHSFFRGVLPGNIGCEMHVSYLAPNARHEPEEKHLHNEMWMVRQGTIELHLNGETHTLHAGDTGIAVAGTLHYIQNVGQDVASYFVVEVGSGPLTRSK